MEIARRERPTRVDVLVDALSAEILRGRRTPGERLPTLRALASRFEVTLPTVQRAIATLEEMKLVAARQGSGVRVLDPWVHAGLSILPRWIEALLDDPPAARRVLEDFLELRREMALSLFVGLKRHGDESAFAALEEAVDAFVSRVGTRPDDREGVLEADLAVGRALLAVRPQIAYATVFNAFADLLGLVPVLSQAIYAEPEANAEGYLSLVALLGSDAGEAELRIHVEALMKAHDAATAERFEALLGKERP